MGWQYRPQVPGPVNSILIESQEEMIDANKPCEFSDDRECLGNVTRYGRAARETGPAEDPSST
jgi:hypothetical protein